MSEGWIDPGSLQGDALTQWYLRSPADLERERQEAAARRYQEFFYGGVGNDSDPQFGREVPVSSQDIDPAFAMPAPTGNNDPGFAMPAPPGDIDPGFAGVAAGPNGPRGVGIATDGQLTDTSLPDIISDNSASFTDGELRSDVSYRAPTSTPPINGFRRADAQAAQPIQQPSIDPSRTPVFQTGPDGKLHPIPGWHTTGPFDFRAWSHNIHWGGVANDLGKIVAGIPVFFSGVGEGAELLSALGPEAETAVSEGIAESPAVKSAAGRIHRHHLDPKYMGGSRGRRDLRSRKDASTRNSTACSTRRTARPDSRRVVG